MILGKSSSDKQINNQKNITMALSDKSKKDEKDKKKGAAATGSKFNMSSNTKTAGKSQTTGGNSAANRSRGAQRGS